MIKVHPGHVGMFEGSVSFEVDHVKGIKNMVFGGDGIFLAQLTGPGKVCSRRCRSRSSRRR